jgi:threonine synthase
MMAACRDMAVHEGIFAAPEGGAALAAVQTLVRQRKIEPRETITVFSTGSGYKYLEAWRGALGM